MTVIDFGKWIFLIDWKKTIQDHGSQVWNIVFRIVGNEADASDCFQDVFTNAVRAANGQVIRNMPGFLSVLATRQALSLLRKRIRDNGHAVGGIDCEHFADPAATPIQQMQNIELGEQLRIGLSNLPENEAQAFSLRALNEFSYRQIADELQIDENYVGVLVHRARSKLQTFLKSVTVEERREVAHEEK